MHRRNAYKLFEVRELIRYAQIQRVHMNEYIVNLRKDGWLPTHVYTQLPELACRILSQLYNYSSNSPPLSITRDHHQSSLALSLPSIQTLTPLGQHLYACARALLVSLLNSIVAETLSLCHLPTSEVCSHRDLI